VTAAVLRLAPAAPVASGRLVEVPFEPHERQEAERLRAVLAGLESVRSGRRTVEIVPAGGAR
jgi:hypothetical protein